MKTLKQDMNSQLNEIDRWWLRIPFAILSTPFILLILVAEAIWNTVVAWFIPIVLKKSFPEDI